MLILPLRISLGQIDLAKFTIRALDTYDVNGSPRHLHLAKF